MKLKLLIIFTSILTYSFAQKKIVFDRLQAIENNDLTFYDIEGIRITKQNFNYSFDKRGLRKAYRKYRIKRKEVKTKDSLLPYKHVLVTTKTKINEEYNQYSAIYFIENPKKGISVIYFNSYKKDRILEREFINLALHNKIPKRCFAEPKITMIDFVGRFIKLGSSCNWMDINNVQCPGYGQMNWSVHENLKSAQQALHYQLTITKLKSDIRLKSEEQVSIEFEGVTTKATKIEYVTKGGTSFLISLSGAKTLNVYYVACKVRNHYVSCVLSFWNNDAIRKSGLPPLLEEVMKIKTSTNK
ncbi:hypothetical protein [Tenacibaculum jejuense]|uniref:Uncharacterized protein n=1 Tax=Tenacibaculum jejuense TaxID=584609 RepID=A0A238UD15_9FLAO|nr:hypothetical protein [Tenacibaculum jejuense]SNR17103.1 conserved protein of unknown function [Tenacibaculum jejuense]